MTTTPTAPPAATAPPAPTGMERSRRQAKLAALLVLGAGGLVLACLVHVTQGQAGLGFGDAIGAILSPDGSLQDAVVRQVRLPRTSIGVIIGAALGVSGALMQTVTRNPLASPTTLGINAGAFLAIVASAIFFPGVLGLSPITIAFLGGVAAAALVYLIAASVHITPVRLVLAGMAITLAAAAITAGLQLFYENETAGLFFWGQGSLVQNDWSGVVYAGPRVLAAIAGAMLMGRALDIFVLGDDVARSLGQHIQRTRLGATLLAVFLAAVGAAVTGPVGFVGLVAPHIVRLSGATRHRVVFIGAALWGALLVVLADVFARMAVTNVSEVPVGVVTAFVGAPFMVWLVRRARTSKNDAEQAGAASLPSGSAHRYPLKVVTATAVVAAVFVGGLMVGDVTVGPGELWQVVQGHGSDLAGRIVVEFRLPRLLVAILAGASLAVSGAIIQGVIRNPLAAPEIVGVTTGAGLGALLVLIAIPGLSSSAVPLGAFVGGLGVFAIVYAASWKDGIHPDRLALVGIVASAFCLAAINLVVVQADVRIAQALVWITGSTYARSWDQVLGLVAWPVLLIPIAWVGGRQLDLLALGERAPRSLGLNIERARLVLLGIGVALAAAAVTAVGTIAFVGLIAPHIARMLVGSRMRRVIPLAALLGAGLIALADVVGRVALAPQQIPTGLVTALIGTPYFVWLMWRSRPGSPAGIGAKA